MRTNKPISLEQERVNDAWDEIINRYENPKRRRIYLESKNFPFMENLAASYKARDITGFCLQYISALSKDEAVMFYAFVILAEGWEIPS